jgi:hypothetical protein
MIKHKYKIIIFLIILIGFFWFVQYSLELGGEYMFDMKTINGVSDNNSYGIRNDVYTYIDNDIKKWSEKHPEFKDPKVRFLILNYEKAELMSIKYFSSKSKVLEAGYQQLMIGECLFKKSDPTQEFVYSLISTYGNKTERDKIMIKTKDHELISHIVTSYFNGKTLVPDNRNPLIHPELCDRYENRVLDDQEFTVQDHRIIFNHQDNN